MNFQWLAPDLGPLTLARPPHGVVAPGLARTRSRPAEQIAPLVLVVEDDPSLQEAMRRHLAGKRLEVATALDYQAALKWLASHTPALACIDLCLPTESGYELCEHFRRTPALSRVPILVTSERGFAEDMANAEEAGANAFLRKPFAMRLLAETVEELLER
ncbi:MAG TPA: response regulator [Polyangiaceae bacterium]|jgi:two-component system chemotaxis response regulator CheY